MIIHIGRSAKGILLAGAILGMVGPEAWGQGAGAGATAATPPPAPSPAVPAAPKAKVAPPHVEIPEIAPRPEDVGSLDGIVAAFYDVISGPPGQPRQWARDRTLYFPQTQFLSTGARPDGSIAYRIFDHGAYVDRVNPGFVKDGFFEREIHRVVHRFDNIVHIFSTYEARNSAQGPVVERGVNSIELFFDGKRWWIAFASWEEERPGSPIPKELQSSDAKPATPRGVAVPPPVSSRGTRDRFAAA
jgi:hypothetical protein